MGVVSHVGEKKKLIASNAHSSELNNESKYSPTVSLVLRVFGKVAHTLCHHLMTD